MKTFAEFMAEHLIMANKPYQNRDTKRAEGIYYPQDFINYCLTYENKHRNWHTAINAHESGAWLPPEHDCLIMNKGKGLERAINAFFEGPTVTDCAMVLQACMAKYFYEKLGHKPFKQLVNDQIGDFLLTPFLYQERSETLPIHLSNPWFFMFKEVAALEYETMGSLEESLIEPGDILHVRGVIGYEQKHPIGNSGGWNLICTEIVQKQHKYLGFGPDYFKDSLSLADIGDLLVAGYNREQYPISSEMIENVLASTNDEEEFNCAKKAYDLSDDKAGVERLGGIRRIIRLKE